MQKDKKSYIEKYENGLTSLKQLMAAEEELSEHVVANEEEVAKAEAIYNQVQINRYLDIYNSNFFTYHLRKFMVC